MDSLSLAETLHKHISKVETLYREFQMDVELDFSFLSSVSLLHAPPSDPKIQFTVKQPSFCF